MVGASGIAGGKLIENYAYGAIFGALAGMLLARAWNFSGEYLNHTKLTVRFKWLEVGDGKLPPVKLLMTVR